MCRHLELENAIVRRNEQKAEKKYKLCSRIFGTVFIVVTFCLSMVCFIMVLYTFLRFMFAYGVLEAGGVTYMRPGCWLVMIASIVVILQCIILTVAIIIWYTRFMLFTYLTFLLTSVALIIGGSLVLWSRNQYGWNPDQFTNTALNPLIYDYEQPGHDQWTSDLDQTQRYFQCCALRDNGWQAYQDSEWFAQIPGTEGYDKACVPLSCCVRDQYGGYNNAQQCRVSWQRGAPCAQGSITNQYVFYPGCSQWMLWIITQFGFPIGGIAVANGAIILLSVIGAVLASCVM